MKNEQAQSPPAASSAATNALRWFYERLSFSDEDRKLCLEKRGLTARSCELAGLKSNPRSNEKYLREMPDNFPLPVLIESGLWSDARPPASPKPHAQFYGWGLVKRGKSGEEDEWNWTQPILIPYFDDGGEVIHLRPHKGGVKDKGVRFFIVRPRKDARFPAIARAVEYAIITDGEFKGLALWQALTDCGSGVAIATLPGITTSKTLFGDIEDWLDELGVKQVIVNFDNEENTDGGKPVKATMKSSEEWRSS